MCLIHFLGSCFVKKDSIIFKPYAGINWLGGSYLGIDVAACCLRENERYAHAKRVFMRGDWCSMNTPPKADLAICKDVLQHWSHEDICEGLARLKQ